MISGAKTKKAGASAPHFQERLTQARARPRRSPRSSHDDVFDRAIADFAESYADQNERDHQGLLDAVKTDRIQAQTGV
jgi:hypothetical protein